MTYMNSPIFPPSPTLVPFLEMGLFGLLGVRSLISLSNLPFCSFWLVKGLVIRLSHFLPRQLLFYRFCRFSSSHSKIGQ